MPDDRNDSNFFPGNYSFREPVICGCENIDEIRLNQLFIYLPILASSSKTCKN